VSPSPSKERGGFLEDFHSKSLFISLYEREREQQNSFFTNLLFPINSPSFRKGRGRGMDFLKMLRPS
jgi:hypothetical protein